VGRPRADGRAIASPREEILFAAARLFAEFGYANTTMSDIARAAGLHQSSLYYWFRRKEMILRATMEVNRLPVEFLHAIEAEDDPSLNLYRLLRYDTYQLCMSPFDVNEVERLAEQQPDVFVAYWEDNQRLYEGVRRLVGDGVDRGELIPCDPALVSLGLLSTQEGMQKRFRYQRLHTREAGNPFVYDAYDAETVAEAVAESALRGLLRRPRDLARIQRVARSHDDF
jgi:AcrR family transcriptional regulator